MAGKWDQADRHQRKVKMPRAARPRRTVVKGSGTSAVRKPTLNQSFVGGFERHLDAFIESMTRRGMQLTTTADYMALSLIPTPDWTGGANRLNGVVFLYNGTVATKKNKGEIRRDFFGAWFHTLACGKTAAAARLPLHPVSQYPSK
jgi:hypothetical protein